MKTFGSLTHKHGVILSVNTKAEQLLGLDTSELIGMNFFDFMQDQYKAEALEVMTKGKQYLYTVNFTHPKTGDVTLEVWPESNYVSAHKDRTIYFKRIDT